MTRASSVPLLLLLASGSACYRANSEERTLQIGSDPLFYSAAVPFESGSRVLPGSNACIEIQALYAGGDWWDDAPFDQCYAITRDGQPFEDGQCITFDALGEVAIEYAPLATCPVEELAGQLVPDRYRLQAIAPDGLRGALEWHEEELAEIWAHPGPRGRFPSDWIPPVDAPLRLVPDVAVPFSVVVVDATGERVGWDLGQGRVMEARAGQAARELDAVPDYPGYFRVSIGAGERSTLALALPELELPVAEVIATPADEAASLEIVVAYGKHDDPEQWVDPVGARAIVRDADDRPLVGAPVQWSLIEGHLAMGPLGDDEGIGKPPEYLGFGDSCDPPPAAPETRRAVLQARLGELVDEVELEWTALPDDEPSEEPFQPDPACQRAGEDDGLGDRGCGCSTRAAAGDAGWLAWGLVLLGAVRSHRGRGRGRRGQPAPRP